MAVVWRALDTQLGRTVAVKVLHAHLHAREDGQLGSYGYMNKDEGSVRLPIRRAMELLATDAAEGKLRYPTQDQKVKKDPTAPVQTASK